MQESLQCSENLRYDKLMESINQLLGIPSRKVYIFNGETIGLWRSVFRHFSLIAQQAAWGLTSISCHSAGSQNLVHHAGFCEPLEIGSSRNLLQKMAEMCRFHHGFMIQGPATMARPWRFWWPKTLLWIGPWIALWFFISSIQFAIQLARPKFHHRSCPGTKKPKGN